MSRFCSRSKQLLPVSIIMFGVAACGTDVSESVLPLAMSYPNVREPVPPLSITDADGTGYTLDVGAGEIRFSDGRVLVLDAAQTAEAVAAFSRVTVTDGAADAVSQFTAPDCGQPLCQYSAPPVSSDGPVVLWREAKHGKSKKGKHIGMTFEGADSKRGLSLASTTAADKCSDVANIAVSTASAYRSNRTTFVRMAWAVGVEGSIALTRFLPAGTGAAQVFADYVADQAQRSIAVSILAYTWNTYNCSSQTVTAGPVYRNGGGGGVPSASWRYECVNEMWEISFDGGSTWSPITVMVCHYVA